MKTLSGKPYRLSQEQIESYRVNGYLIVPLFSAEECRTIMGRITPHANKDFAVIMNPDREQFLCREAPHSSRESVSETSRFMRHVMKDARLVSIIETLQGKEIVGIMSQMIFKEPCSRYAAQAWNPHQDNSYPRSPNKQYVTINIFLEDADTENGSLYVYPGTHNEDILPFEPTVSYREGAGANPGNTCQVPSGYKKVDLAFKQGDVLFLHGNTVHGSYPNISKTRPRPMYSCSYITKGEPFVPGNTAKRTAIPLHGEKLTA